MIRMSTQPLGVGARFWGDRLAGDTIIGEPFEITGPATREEFAAQYAPGEMTAETEAFLAMHPVLYFYRTEPLQDLIGLLMRACRS